MLSDKVTILLTWSLYYLTTISCNGLAIWECTCRQYYSYVTDTQCKRVGTQCWVYGAIMVTEALLCIKNGKELFERTQAINIIIWLLLQLLLSVLCVYGCVLWHKYIQVCWISPIPTYFWYDDIVYSAQHIIIGMFVINLSTDTRL